MNLLGGITNRINAVVGGILAAICFLALGALFAFVLSPGQTADANRIERLPELDAAGLAAVSTGDEAAITGVLEGNETLTEDGFVAYIREEWNVEPAQNSNSNSNSNESDRGSWQVTETNAPGLTLTIEGGSATTLTAGSVTMSGNLHETAITRGTGAESANYEGQSLPEGSSRLRGLQNGDLVTVVGTMATTGDIAPNRLFGGDRVQLVQEIRTGAQVMFWIGLAMMVCSPLVLVGGILGGIFGRRRAAMGGMGKSGININLPKG